ncbi:MAG: NADP-dependent malic enzyme [Nanoarchaeota archaeon]|nr:NADP-dependent malic enzyme [Nanoarchaeota archaeon]
MDYQQKSIELHREFNGKLQISSKIKVTNKEELSLAYSPGVAGPCLEIAKNEGAYKELTSMSKTIAVISDGSAVLGLGNIGAKASMPVMEGKCVLMNEFAGINAMPIILDTQDTQQIIETIANIAPSFGGINLEDISAPRCFEIEDELKKRLKIPVFHDDQHGTAIVTLAGIINYAKLSGKDTSSLKVVINGSGAAGVAIAKLLDKFGVEDIIVCDSKGAISKDRGDLNSMKQTLLEFTNKENKSGSVYDVMRGVDVFVGVSVGNLLKSEHIALMNEKPAIFAMANPTPEMMPEDAKEAGVFVIGTGRSDYPNQLNNVLVFPGIFKGALENNVSQITDEMKINAALAIAGLIGDEELTSEYIIPNAFDKRVVDAVASVVKE